MKSIYLDVIGTTWGGATETGYSYRLIGDEPQQIKTLDDAKRKAGDFASLDSAEIRTVKTVVTTRKRTLK